MGIREKTLETHEKASGAKENTLISSFINDLDKNDPRHSLGCQYFEQSNVIDKLCAILNEELPASKFEEEETANTYLFRNYDYANRIVTRTSTEEFITKGTDERNLITVGFLDAVIQYETNLHCIECLTTYDNNGNIISEKTKESLQERVEANIYIEVKSREVPVSKVLQQINMYRAYLPGASSKIHRKKHHWIVATMFDWLNVDQKSLRNAGIIYLRLGKDFDNWCAMEAQAEKIPMIEL